MPVPLPVFHLPPPTSTPPPPPDALTRSKYQKWENGQPSESEYIQPQGQKDA